MKKRQNNKPLACLGSLALLCENTSSWLRRYHSLSLTSLHRSDECQFIHVSVMARFFRATGLSGRRM